LHKPAEQFPYTLHGGSASKAVDGNTSDNVVGEMCAHTYSGTPSNPAWWTVDLKAYFKLTGIKIYNRNKAGEQKMYTLASVNKPSLTAKFNVHCGFF